MARGGCVCAPYGGGGGDWGYLELGPGTPPWVRGSIYKKKVQDPGPNTHTAATIRKEVLTPPTPPQKGVPRCGGGGVQGYIGVCYATDPKKGEHTTLAPALDLTT